MDSYKFNEYKVVYSSHLNKFVVVNVDTNASHSIWRYRKDAEMCKSDLEGMKMKFEANLKLQALNIAPVQKPVNVIKFKKKV